MGNEISRRSFLKGALATGAVAAGAGLAGCAPAQPAANGEDAAQAQAGRWSWSVEPDPVPDSAIEETIECDVLIIGAGAAGVPAALYAGVHGIDAVVMQ